MQRPFDGKTQDALAEAIKKAQPRYYVTNPAVSVLCLRAMAALMEKDRTKRIGAAGFHTFTSHPFFAELDFEALERKEIPPIFVPSSDKTNFDATYDLEELLLEEAPLEARARRQKPRAELREDATPKEIREDELHRMIETMFEPFDYTTAKYDGNAAAALANSGIPEDSPPTAGSTNAESTHSRQASQPRTSEGSPPGQIEGSTSRPNPPETVAPMGEALQPQESAPEADPSAMPPVTSVQSQPPPPPSFSRPLPPRPKGSTRKMSKGGGVQMVLEETGSWSELADQSTTLPAEGLEGVGGKGKQNSGMLAFLTRKKGRDRSPKPQEPGVLGKEGARQIIS